MRSEMAVRQAQKGDGALTVDAVTSSVGARELVPEWSALHARSETDNPFTHPSWALTWAAHFVAEGDLFIVAVHRNGALVGVVPLYWARLARSRRAFASLHLLGNGPCAQFTEVPGLLVERDQHRDVVRAAVRFLQDEAPRWDWVKLTLDAQQGWFEPQWLAKRGDRPPFHLQHATRASVVLDLPPMWEQFLSDRKRNVRESIRRSRNRLDKRVGDWAVASATTGPELQAGLVRTVQLHGARSEMAGKPNHPTMFGPPEARAFYVEAVTAMAEAGQAEVSTLRCGDRVLAGLVALRANSQMYVSATGADPAAWEFGPGTVMLAELVRRSIATGATGVNLSTGPNQSKLRWSERLAFNHDFVIAGAGAAARARTSAYCQISSLAALRRAARWDTVTGGEEG